MPVTSAVEEFVGLKPAADNIGKFGPKFFHIPFAIGVNPVCQDDQKGLRFRIDPERRACIAQCGHKRLSKTAFTRRISGLNIPAKTSNVWFSVRRFALRSWATRFRMEDFNAVQAAPLKEHLAKPCQISCRRENASVARNASKLARQRIMHLTTEHATFFQSFRWRNVRYDFPGGEETQLTPSRGRKNVFLSESGERLSRHLFNDLPKHHETQVAVNESLFQAVQPGALDKSGIGRSLR